ncbi:MAG: dolichyl-phosphate beta-glucosyltransferase, partial [Acidobacteriota bacterium]
WSMPHLSVVIPAYNEESRISKTLGETLDYLDAQTYSSEIIVVDDGSSDCTEEVVLSFKPRAGDRLSLLHNPGNRGKGYAVRNGVLHANGDIILFCDADLSTPPGEISKVIGPIDENRYDVVFGSRAITGSRIDERQSALREAIGRTGNLLLQTLTGMRFKDTQCGFKAFRLAAAHSAFGLQRIDGFGFDPEVLYIAQKQGWRLLETPVRWSNVEGSKVNALLTPIKVLLEVMTIRWNDVLGRYGHAPPQTAAPHP